MKTARRFSRASGSTRRRIEDILAGRRRSTRTRLDPLELSTGPIGSLWAHFHRPTQRFTP